MKKDKILITGVSGFIGKSLIKELSDKYDVIGVDNKHCSLENFIKVDLSNEDFTKKLPKDIDIILHLAAIVNKDVIKKDPFYIFKVNTLATLNLLEYGKNIKIKKFIYTSTGSVYAQQESRISEEITPKPAEIYGLSKYCSEILIHGYSDYFKTMILRLFYPYGPGQDLGRFIPDLFYKIRNHQPITAFNHGKNPKINPIYIDDLIRIIKSLVDKDRPTVLNIGGLEEYTVEEIAEIVSRLEGIKPVFDYIVNPKIKNWVGDISKLNSLNLTPTITLSEGLRKIHVYDKGK